MTASAPPSPDVLDGGVVPLVRSALSERTSLRIGLISDTHIPEARAELWPQVFTAFDGVDAILHGGDIHELGVLDQLADVAPLWCARGNGEDGSAGRPVAGDDPRLRYSWLLDLAGVHVGLTHDLPLPEHPPNYTVERWKTRRFGTQDIDVLVYGDSHVERIDIVAGTLCVNPGSPTYPHNLMTQLGTLGFLDIDAGAVRASLWQLTDDGVHGPTTELTAERDERAVEEGRAVTYENLLVDLDGPVATLTLNRPEQLNALSTGLLDDLHAALRELNPGDAVRVIRLRGSGRAFCPGYDLAPSSTYSGPPPRHEVRGTALADLGESSIARDREALREMIDRWLWMWNYRKPVIAQTHGYCLSGGLDLIGACDIVFAAEGTLFGHPAARGMGIPVTLGMMPLRIGAAATKELLFTGDAIDAVDARRLGLISHVVPADELDDRTMAFCQRVALNPLDILTVHKHVTNRWSEVMGLRLAAFEGAEYDAIAHLTPSMREFSRRTNEDGCRAALAWRDGPYSWDPPPITTPPSGATADAVARQPGPVRILHASDLHVGDSVARSDAVGPLVDAALAHAVDAVVLVGDTFDHNRVPTEVGQALVDELARLDVPVVVLPGNHDCLVPGAIWSRVVLPANVQVLTDPAGEQVELVASDMEIWGRPHPDYLDLRPLAGLPPRGERTWQVALAHGHMVLGPADLHRAYLITPDEIAESARDYVALGHWDVPHDMTAGGVTARYSGSASRFAVCALVTLTHIDDERRIDVQQLELAPAATEDARSPGASLRRRFVAPDPGGTPVEERRQCQGSP